MPAVRFPLEVFGDDLQRNRLEIPSSSHKTPLGGKTVNALPSVPIPPVAVLGGGRAGPLGALARPLPGLTRGDALKVEHPPKTRLMSSSAGTPPSTAHKSTAKINPHPASETTGESAWRLLPRWCAFIVGTVRWSRVRPGSSFASTVAWGNERAEAFRQGPSRWSHNSTYNSTVKIDPRSPSEAIGESAWRLLPRWFASIVGTEYEDWSLEEQRTVTSTNTPHRNTSVCDAASPSTAEPFMPKTQRAVSLGARGIVE
ncbi:unnamed protein product [Ectocarpus sp. 6 AP-2014]